MAERKVETLVNKSMDKIPYHYSMTIAEIEELLSLFHQDSFEGLLKAYYYGFIKGTRAKARNKVPTL